MDIKCTSCSASLLKSYGATIKLRSKSIRWEGNDTAVVQCNMCRSFNDLPLEFCIKGGSFVIELGNEIRKSQPQAQRFVVDPSKKSEKK